MRSAVLQLARTRTAMDRRQVLRAAIRQLERADLYFDAVAAMEIDDRDARRAVQVLRRDIEALRRHLISLRADT
ncbi:MAG TPA: hypothetical protein VFL27_08020 [Candidatus Dormibacteraeota bacterium]|nr:hypothetical protein [Candidatus Dormibacteraeota bacterium]